MFESMMKQNAVYWAVDGTVDGYGLPGYETPVEIKIRWQDSVEIVNTDTGEEQRSRAIVYSGENLKYNDYLYLGDLDDLSVDEKADPQKVSTAYPVIKKQKSVDLNSSDSFLVKVWL